MSRPSSILHVGKFYPPHPGGMETHLRNLVSYQSLEAKVTVIVSNVDSQSVTESLDGAAVHRLATYGNIASSPVTPSLLWRLRGRSDDIVHLHLPNPAAAVAYLVSGHPGKLIITHHGDTTGRETLRRLTDPFVRRVMTRASSIIVSSQRYVDSSTELYDFRDKCSIIPLGIDTPAISIDAELVSSIRARYGDRIVLAIGRLVPYKGFAYLIRALKNTDASLVLIGEGSLLSELRALAEKVGVADRTHFLGYIKDLNPYFQAASIFALPSISRAESFGLVQLEAMAAGLPVINTDLASAVPEVSLHGVTGLTVPPADEEALASAIRSIISDKALAESFGNAAIKRAKNFSAKAMMERTMAAYF